MRILFVLVSLVSFSPAWAVHFCPSELLTSRNAGLETAQQNLNLTPQSLSFDKAFSIFATGMSESQKNEVFSENGKVVSILDWLETVYLDAAVVAAKTGKPFENVLPFRMVDLEPVSCPLLSDVWCWAWHWRSPRLQQRLSDPRIQVSVPTWFSSTLSVPSVQTLKRHLRNRSHLSVIDRLSLRRSEKVDSLLSGLRKQFEAEGEKVLTTLTPLIQSLKSENGSSWSHAQIRASVGGIVEAEIDLSQGPSPLANLPSDLSVAEWTSLLQNWNEKISSRERENLLSSIEAEMQKVSAAPASSDWKISIAPILIRSTDRVSVQTQTSQGMPLPGVAVESQNRWQTRHFNLAFLLVDTLDEIDVSVTVLRGTSTRVALESAIRQTLAQRAAPSTP